MEDELELLSVSNYDSHTTAFEKLRCRVNRVRPVELTRGGFDSLLEFVKSDQYDMVWVDLAYPKRFVVAAKLSVVLQRLRALITACKRYDVPFVMTSSHSSVWETQSVRSLLDVCGLYTSTHRWCAFGIKTSSGNPSAVTHRCASTFKWQSTPCTCSPDVEHVHDLAAQDPTCTAHRRHLYEVEAVTHLLGAAWIRESVSGKSADSTLDATTSSERGHVTMSAANEISQHDTHDEVSIVSPKAKEPEPNDRATERFPLPVQSTEQETLHNFSHEFSPCPGCQLMMLSTQAFCSMCETPLETLGYPTEARLAAQKRQKAGIQPKKKAKTVEQHFDDCGEDLTPLQSHATMFDGVSDESSEDETAEAELSHLLSSFVTHGFYGSECDAIPATHSGTILAVDWEEAFAILTNKPYGVEIVELCGGMGTTSYMCIRRHMSAGHNFELLTGCDLTDPAVQSKVLAYLDIAKPLVVVMGPRCDPYGPLGRWNQTVHPEGWQRSYNEAAPLAEFCGKVALLQISRGRHFLCEQPQTSALFQEEPWPKVMQHHSTRRIVFHQCRVGQYINGQLCKKATELVASSSILLQPFVGLICKRDHVHATLTGGQASKAQRWSKPMCDRIAFGIQQLRKSLLKEQKVAQVLPSVEVDASGGEPAAEAVAGESWRKCKGCRWRLPKEDPEHNRVVGECKHPEVPSMAFDCPGCKAHRARDHASHTYGPDCRHAVTSGRKKAHKRQQGHVPTSSEPTSTLRARHLGDADEQEAEDRLEMGPDAPSASGSAGDQPASAAAAPGEPHHESGESGDLQIVPAEGAQEQAGRGPDVLQRIRRTYKEGDAQTPDPSDWTSFDISASLRGLRIAPEAGQRRILRKLHLRWWHASANRMEQLLKAAGLDRKILDLIPEIVDSCRVCRTWQKPSSDNIASSRMVTGFNLEVEGDIVFISHGGVTHPVLHLVDRGVRWAYATVLKDKSTASLLEGLDQWLTVFGPMPDLRWRDWTR